VVLFQLNADNNKQTFPSLVQKKEEFKLPSAAREIYNCTDANYFIALRKMEFVHGSVA